MASILGAPAASTSTISVDWMHCVELGVGQDMVANVFWELLHKDGPVMQGANFAARLERLSASLRAYNARAKPKNPISVLTKKMLKQTGQSPKLKSKAAECRGIQGFALELAMELVRLDPSEHNILVLQCVDALVACSAVVTALPFNLAEFQRLGHHFLDSCHKLHAWGRRPRSGELNRSTTCLNTCWSRLPQLRAVQLCIGTGLMRAWGAKSPRWH